MDFQPGARWNLSDLELRAQRLLSVAAERLPAPFCAEMTWWFTIILHGITPLRHFYACFSSGNHLSNRTADSNMTDYWKLATITISQLHLDHRCFCFCQNTVHGSLFYLTCFCRREYEGWWEQSFFLLLEWKMNAHSYTDFIKTLLPARLRDMLQSAFSFEYSVSLQRSPAPIIF